MNRKLKIQNPKSTLTLLSSLALATVAQANATGYADTITSLEYAADPGVLFGTLSNLQRSQLPHGPGPVYYALGGPEIPANDPLLAGATTAYGFSTDYSLTPDPTAPGPKGKAVLKSHADLTMFSNDATFAFAEVNLGRRVVFSFENPTADFAQVTLTITAEQAAGYDVTVPLDAAQTQAIDYATTTAFSQGFDLDTVTYHPDTDSYDLADEQVVYTYVDSFYDPSTFGVAKIDRTASYPSAANPQNLSLTLTLAPGTTKLLGLTAYSDVLVGHVPAPVPEPAAFLPLGLGALALLRRRR